MSKTIILNKEDVPKLINKLHIKIKDQDLQISKLKDDVQYWMKRANANGYRALDRRSDK